MKNYLSFLLTLFIICAIAPQNSSAQFGGILGDVAKDVVDEVVDDVTDEVRAEMTRRIAAEISKRAVRKVNSVMDSIFKESYEQDSIESGHAARSYEDFLNAMNQSVDLPEHYIFDVLLEVELKDYDGEKSKFDMYLSKSSPIFGIKQTDKKNKSDFIIVDKANDIFAIYDEESKTVQAIPSLMSISGAIAKSAIEDELEDLKIERTNKTKKIAGYESILFTSESEDENTKTYIAENFPVDWRNSVGKMGADFVPPNYLEQYEDMKGFMLQSDSEFKSNGKKSSWRTKKVKIETLDIDNSKYSKESVTGN